MARRAGRRARLRARFLDGRDVPPQSGLGLRRAARGVLGELGVGADRDRHGPLLRDGPRQPLGPRREGVAGARARRGRAGRRPRPRRSRASLRGRRHRRVRRARRSSAPRAHRDGDAVVFFNFRPDRAREITRAFADPDVRGLRAAGRSRSVRFVCLTEYDPTIPAPVAFAKDLPEHVLADVLAEHGPAPAPHRRDREVRARHVLPQRRRRDAEGGRGARPRAEPEGRDVRPAARDERARGDRAARRGDRARIEPTSTSSTTRTATWSATPASSTAAVARRRGGRRRRRARSSRRFAREGGVALITADHGNAEQMVDADGATPFTAHTLVRRAARRVSPTACPALAAGRHARRRRADAARPHRRAETPAEWTGASLLIY